MLTGLNLLLWILGLTVLAVCYWFAVRLEHPAEDDEQCSRVDLELDAQDARDQMMRREVRL